MQKNNSIGISVFVYENKVKYPIMCQKNVLKKKKKKHVDLLLIGEEDKRHFVLLKDCNTIY